MNRLSHYITGMTLTRQHLRESRARMLNKNQPGAILSLLDAFEAFVAATSCAVSIREGKKPKGGRS